MTLRKTLYEPAFALYGADPYVTSRKSGSFRYANELTWCSMFWSQNGASAAAVRESTDDEHSGLCAATRGVCAMRPRAAKKSGRRNMSANKTDEKKDNRENGLYTPRLERLFVRADWTRHGERSQRTRGTRREGKERCGTRPTYEPGERDLWPSLSCIRCKNLDTLVPPCPCPGVAAAESDIRCREQ